MAKPKVLTDLTVSDLKTSWGLVEAYDEKGKLLRSRKATPTQLSAIFENRTPVGFSPAWLSADRVVSSARPLNERQCIVSDNGALVVNERIFEADGFVIPFVIEIPEGLWELKGGKIYVTDGLLS